MEQNTPTPTPVNLNQLPVNPKFEEAKALTERLERAGAELKMQADRMEQLRADQLLSGTAGLGQQGEQKTPEQLKKEEIAKFWEGSQLHKPIVKYG